MAVGTRCADHVTPLYPQRLELTSPTGGGRSVGIVRVLTKATEFSFTISWIYDFSRILIIVQRDATQSSLFIILQVHSTCFGCQPHPLSGVHKTVTTAFDTGHNFLCSYLQASLATLEGGSCTVPEAVVTVLCTPDDGCG